MAQKNDLKKPRTRFQKTVQWVTLLILISFVTGSIIVGGLSFRSSQNVKTPSAVNSPASNNNEEELQRWLEAAKLNPKDPFTLRSLAKAEMRSGRYEDAEKTLHSALSAAPEDPLTIELLGQLCLGMGKGKEALGQFKKALAAKPEDLALNYEVALAYSLFGDEHSALHYYQVVAAKAGNDRAGLSARMAMLQIYKHEWEFKKAESIGLGLDSMMPGNPQIMASLIDIFEGEKNWTRAIAYAKKLQQSDPANAENSARLAQLYSRSGNPMEAGEIWADLISKNPRNPSYKYDLALIDKKTGKTGEAKDLFERARQEAAEEHNKTLEQKIEADARGL